MQKLHIQMLPRIASSKFVGGVLNANPLSTTTTPPKVPQKELVWNANCCVKTCNGPSGIARLRLFQDICLELVPLPAKGKERYIAPIQQMHKGYNSPWSWWLYGNPRGMNLDMAKRLWTVRLADFGTSGAHSKGLGEGSGG